MTLTESQAFWEKTPCLPDVVGEKYIDKYEREVNFVFNYDFKNKEVLDLGCGTGNEVWILARMGAHVTAVDFTTTALNLTQQLLDKYHLNAKLEKCNIEELPFDDNTFDFVISLGVIHHTVNPDKTITEVYRVLKPNGIFVVALYNTWMPWAKRWLGHEPYEKQQWDKGCPIVKFYTKNDIKKLLKGFSIIKIRGFASWIKDYYWPIGKLIVLFGLDKYFGMWYVKAKKEMKQK